MNEPKDIFKAFIQGTISFDRLLAAIDKISSEAPNKIPQLQALTALLEKKGKLSAEQRGTLQAHLALPSDAADKTQIAPNKVDDKTQIAPAAVNDKTVIAIDHATPDTDKTQISSRATTADTSAPPPTTSGIKTATRKISHEPQVGDTLKGRFVLEKVIGRGGMGVVFKALDNRKVEARDRHPYVALKLLNESFKNHEDSLIALQREARKAQDLKHPNVIGIFDFDRDENDNYFIAMELLQGRPLDEVIKEQHGVGMPQDRAMRMITMMGLALAAAHNQNPPIVHSDFKPGNVFLADDDDIKVFDFGIARAAKPKDINSQGSDVTAFDASTLGALTPTYASLEMLEGIEPDPSDDIYALAIVAYELFTGNRPFGRLPATEAKKQGLKPQQISSLTHRQWKGLQRGLAFDRKERTATAEEFLDDLRFRKSKLPLIASLSAITIGLISWLFIPPYLEKRQEEEISKAIKAAEPAQIPTLLESGAELSDENRQQLAEVALQQIINTIREGDSAEIQRTLNMIKRLPTALHKQVISNTKELILSYYIGEAERLFAPQQQHYNYLTASQTLSQASALYPDSVLIFKTQQRMDDSRNDLLNALDERFNKSLMAGRLLPVEDEDDIPEILTIISQLDPLHDLLNDARLANAYTEAATKALQKTAFAEAEQYANAGLALFNDDVALSNIKAKIHIARRGVEARKRLAAIQKSLQQNLASAATIDDYQDLTEELLDLKAAAPKDPLLKRAEKQLRLLLNKEISRLLESHDWQQSEKLLSHFNYLLSTAYQITQQKRLDKIKHQDEQRSNRLFANLLQAVAEEKLSQPEGESAIALLAKASRIVPNDPRINQSRNSIAYGYLLLARAERAEGQWQQAKEKIISGLEIGPSELIKQSLQAEQQSISTAEKGLQPPQTEREERSKQLQQEFTQAEKKMTSTARSSESLLAILDQLAEVSPSDPLLSSGRKQIAEQFHADSERLGQAQEWQQAITLAQQGIEVIPESISLSQQLIQLQQAQQKQHSAGQQLEIQAHKEKVEKLLTKATYSNGWQEDLNQAFAKLENWLLADDHWMVEIREKTGRLYLEEALRKRANKRFTNAESLLQIGEQFAPMMANTFNMERTALAADEVAWQKDNKARAEQARLDGFKKSLLTQAKANDTGKALLSLKSLRNKLPQHDHFLTKTAPTAIGNAYLRLAERRAKRRDYANAVTLIENGLKVAPALSSLQQKLTQYREERTIHKVRVALNKSSAEDLAHLKSELQSLQKRLPKRYPSLSKEFSENLAQRIRATQNRKVAQALLDATLKLFPESKTLQNINLATRTPTKTAQTTKSSPTAKDRCQAKFAGYGKRSSKFRCYDMISSKQKGPIMVVIPAGGGQDRPYAIGRYEISVGDYNNYCKLSGHCTAITGMSTRLPLSGISLESAQQYARWLSEKSGATYRLPTDQEWLHAARGKGSQPLSTDFNCLLLSGGAAVKGGTPVNVNVAPQNSWGLFNYVGNLQEWVAVGSGWQAIGGHYNDTAASCSINLLREHSGSSDKLTGFRLLREIKG
ncbi:MAG: protein kinase [Candidatus Polarisedimenticolaceae bacterium]|nr:protein kinase [Candidatus Polarisedimenticolaceae bacterium]